MKAFTLHGHFYQPPRENPWLWEVERQESASPFHDWNERITHECYRRNIPNYPFISYNFGPTLLAWLAEKAPEVYEKVLQGDRDSRETRGYGNAIAQAYNHIILPLAKERDKRIQIEWGIRDFKMRFGRDPQGMWLPEMAVDMKTLEIMTQRGIKFTILAPHQIALWKPKAQGPWAPFPGKFYPLPLYQKLPGGKGIYIFVYNGKMGEAVSFGEALESPQAFLKLIEAHLKGIKQGLLHFATDGETFGHHKKKGAESLNRVLARLKDGKVELTNYGAFLDHCPSVPQAQIRENTSWSCSHGIERWRSDCGCATGGDPGWNQKWRAPFRESMDWLKEKLDAIFEEEGGKLFKDPWEAFLDYSEVMVKGPGALPALLRRHQGKALTPKEAITAAKLLEMGRMGQYIFTSCGWFFADISGLESIQNMRFAARAIEIAQEVGGTYLEGGYLDRLYQAKSNVPEEKNGLEIYKRRVVPSRFSARDITAHYLISSFLEGDLGERVIFRYQFIPGKVTYLERETTCLCIGRVKAVHLVFQEEEAFLFALLKYHTRDLHCSLIPFKEGMEGMLETLKEAYERGITYLVRELDRGFGLSFYTLDSLITRV